MKGRIVERYRSPTVPGCENRPVEGGSEGVNPLESGLTESQRSGLNRRPLITQVPPLRGEIAPDNDLTAGKAAEGTGPQREIRAATVPITSPFPVEQPPSLPGAEPRCGWWGCPGTPTTSRTGVELCAAHAADVDEFTDEHRCRCPRPKAAEIREDRFEGLFVDAPAQSFAATVCDRCGGEVLPWTAVA